MKYIISSLAIAGLLASPIVNAATIPYAAPSEGYTVSNVELQTQAQVEWVMKANGISHTEALARIRHGLDSQHEKINPATEVPKDYSPTYNPQFNAIQQNGAGFYAGKAADGSHVFTTEQRAQMLERLYRYCPIGTSFTFEGVTSACK